MTEPYQLTAWQAAEALQARELSARELTASVLHRISQVEDRIHAYQHVIAEPALALAEDIDARRARGEALHPWAGIPIALKDNLCLRDVPATCSSKMLEKFFPPYDATVVEKLRAAGLIPIGKTNLDEFAMGSSTENSAYGRTCNPWNLDYVPGGSSGGSTAAVSADETILALGSDTGGSIRQPAAFCSVTGLKPTYGRVSRWGLIAFASSLDQIGPITKDARDAAGLLRIIAGQDRRDSTSIDAPVPDYPAELTGEIKGLRIGIPKEYMIAGLNAEVRAAVENAARFFEEQGAICREISLPHTEYAIATYYMICTAEASSNLARYDGVVFGHRGAGPFDNLIEMYCQSRSEGFGPEVKRRIMLGTYVLSAGYYDAYYRRAQRVRTLIKRDFDQAFTRVDVILCPATPTPPFPAGAKTGDPLEMYLSDVFTAPVNLAGLPGIAIPGGFSAGGLPIGIQFIGPVLSESLLLHVSHCFQLGTSHHRMKPRL
ncbi:MAG TPA: Asp-tRNA(Asn)/Glu-tRNA(Gln) amidotransferase subunit GatA [bacterium]|nr:Asp-tRNA(Asn)/Glu-tRNA(Gln) amidotransferase subunit GatA [bacterium]HOL93204.1 Asp-tRNA(Asn)/Glu-tRNA(Gln) amidotransferase subunit GatA [bacterium]HPP00181.1 Asp-tRNA(Asn)/Glu-tRNA(Gln) amidotransferase subunit GatA [bacterium]HXK94937.1 Asp-tRNA(Asn)/Glu-tRNA(Gln) amidotransferase subunit GatA [bacterium]